MSEKPRCSELNSKGEPCKSTSVGPSGKCAFHDGKSPLGTAEGARKAAERSAEVRRERAEVRKRTALDWASKLAEENGQEIYECFLQAIKDREWRAAVAIMDRVYGKPQERVETKDVTEKPAEDLGLGELLARARQQLGTQGSAELHVIDGGAASAS